MDAEDGDRPAPPETGALAEIAQLARLAATGVVPDAIRHTRRAAIAAGWTSFALFFTGRGSGASKLVACFDEAFPGSSPATAALLSAGADVLARHASQSALPLCWGMEPKQDQPFIAFSPTPANAPRGIALPVAADGGQAGIFVFTGNGRVNDRDALIDLHNLCYEIFAGVAAVKGGSASETSAISKRELECLRLTAAGRTSEDIARILGLSIHTANQYLTSVVAKLDAVNRTQAVAKAIRLGLVD